MSQKELNEIQNKNRIFIPLSVITLLLFIICSTYLFGEKLTKEEQLDRYINGLDLNSSISILVVDNGEAVYEKSFGYASIDTFESATPSTNYRLASVSKMFTAMSIMILKDRGELDFNMPVNEILTDFPEYGKDITINHLLQHTSGLQSFYDLTDVLGKEFDADNQVLDSDVYEIVKRVDSTYFTPGSYFEYSDTGYIVLGLIVEKVSGKSLPDFMKENIFIPLEMNNTVVFDKTLNTQVNNRAYGIDTDRENWFTKDQSYSSATRGDGSIYSSIDDLYKWDQGLYTDMLVSYETMEEAYTPPKLLNVYSGNYNSGWCFNKDMKGKLFQSHNGSTQGFTHEYTRMPEEKRAVIVLTNRNEWWEVIEIEQTIRRIYGFTNFNPYLY